MSQKLSLRQTRLRTQLPMIGNSVDELGDSVLSKVDAQLAKLFEDRNALLTDGGIITFTGTSVQFTESLKLSLNSKIDGSVQVIDLGSTTRSLSASGRMIYAVIDRTAGTATITDDATALPSVVAANQEVFLIAKRVDAADSTQRIYFRNGSALNAGQSIRLGAAGSGGDTAAIEALQESFQYGFQPFIDTSNLMTATTATGSPAAGTFHSTVINRSPMVDFRLDLGTRAGIERMQIHNIELVPGEYSSSGQQVYRLTNDKWNMVRVIGNWENSALNLNLISGPYISTGDTTAFIEITFYGTGLNVLTTREAATRQMVASVNGGTETSSLLSTTASGVLGSRGYNTNASVRVAEDLSLGVHTVRIRNTNSLFLCGFEVINESTDIKTVPGIAYKNGQKYELASASSVSYNSTFESGTLGTKGGCVLAYLKPDGSVAKAVNPTDATALYTTSTNHSNEEIARTYFIREFGANRVDDYSTANGGSNDNRTFTLDDGTTTLSSNNSILQPIGVGVREGLFANANGSYIDFTFVGTGLDVMSVNTGVVGFTYSIIVDGTTVASGLTGAALRNNGGMYAIASGLPYGTHKVRILVTNAAGNAWIIGAFSVYQPKEPVINSTYIPQAKYFITADFAANTTAGTQYISTGTIRKASNREFVYVNGTGGTQDWAQSTLAVANSVSGHVFSTDRQNSYFDFQFSGTGFDFRFTSLSTGSTGVSLTINGVALTAANFPTATFTPYGTGVTYNSGTGVLDMQDATTTRGSGLIVSGLPYGQYRFRANNNNSGQFVLVESMDIIMPFYAPEVVAGVSNQGVSKIGSTSLQDKRNTTPVKEAIQISKAKAIAYGVTVDPTTTSTTFIPAPDMQCNIVTSGGALEIEFNMHGFNSTVGSAILAAIYVDGKQEGEISVITQPVANYIDSLSNSIILPVAAGAHNVTIMWAVSANTGTLNSDRRTLTVKEL